MLNVRRVHQVCLFQGVPDKAQIVPRAI